MQAMLFRIGDGRSVNGLQLQPNPLIHITALAVLGLFLEGVVELPGRAPPYAYGINIRSVRLVFTTAQALLGSIATIT